MSADPWQRHLTPLQLRLLGLKAEIQGQDYRWRLEFFEDCNTKSLLHGRISYVFEDGSTAILSQQTPWRTRLSWHRLVRLERLRRRGKALGPVLGDMDERERRMLGHPPKQK